MKRWMVVFLFLMLGLTPAKAIELNSTQRVYQMGQVLSLAQHTELEKKLQLISLPVYVVFFVGERTEQTAGKLLDQYVPTWEPQLHTDRYVILILRWSQDCGTLSRRPGHDRCDFAVRFGPALAQIGVTLDQAGLTQFLSKEFISSPEMFLSQIPVFFRRIQAYEEEQFVRANQQHVALRAELERVGNWLKLISLGEGLTPEEQIAIQSALDQIAGAQRAGSIEALLEGKNVAEAQVQLIVRYREEKRRIATLRTVTWIGAVACLALLGFFLFLRARKRIRAVETVMDPALRDLQHYRDRFTRMDSALLQLCHQSEQIQSDLPESAQLTRSRVSQAQHDIQIAMGLTKSAFQYLQVCEGGAQKRSVLVALLTGQCPGTDLSRKLRGTYRIDLPPSGGDTFGMGRSKFVRLEESEHMVAELFESATGMIQRVRMAIFVQSKIATRKISQDYEILKQRARTLRVPSIWINTHPYLKNGEGFFENLKRLAVQDPVVAVEELATYDKDHETLSNNVERIGETLNRLLRVRFTRISIPSGILVDPQDNPRNTLILALSFEDDLFRNLEAPTSTSDVEEIVKQTNIVIGLYEKSMAQYDVLISSYKNIKYLYSEVNRSVGQLTHRIGRIPRTNSNRTLLDLSLSSLEHDLKQIKDLIDQTKYVKAMRYLVIAKTEASRMEEEINGSDSLESDSSDSGSSDSGSSDSGSSDSGSSDSSDSGSSDSSDSGSSDSGSSDSGSSDSSDSGSSDSDSSGWGSGELNLETPTTELPPPTKANKEKIEREYEKEQEAFRKREQEKKERDAQFEKDIRLRFPAPPKANSSDE